MAETGTEGEKEIAYQREVELALRQESKGRATAERMVRKQSEALVGTLKFLLQKPAHADFVRAILRASARECGGVWATLWQSNPGRGGARSISFHLDREIETAVEAFVESHPRDLANLGRLYRSTLEEHRRSVIFDASDRRASPATRRFYQKLGVRSVLVTPLIVGEDLLGWISLLGKYPRNRLDPDRVAFVEASAQQAALAIQLRILNERARQLERAKENERTARAREEELSRVSQSLWVPLMQVTGERDGVEMVLKSVSENMADLIGAESVSLWRRDENLDRHVPAILRQGGRFKPFAAAEVSALTNGLHLHRRLVKSWLAVPEHWIQRTTVSRVRSVLDEIGIHGRATPPAYLVAVPLAFCDEAHGFVLLRTAEREWTNDDRALALRTLAFRAALVLRVHDLSTAQRTAALAEERSRIARDLHDLLAQSFSGITLQIEAMRRECPDLPAAVEDRLAKIRNQAARSVDEMRRALHMLRPALLDHQSLPDALASLAGEMESNHGIPIKVILGRIAPALDSRQEISLYAIASEAMQNAVKHAHPRVIVVTLKKTRLRVLLSIENDERISGRKADSGPPESHLGMKNMRERAAEIGGIFSFQPLRGGGARVRVSVAIAG